MGQPTSKHLLAVKRVLRYVKGTLDYGLINEKGQAAAKLIGHNDSDFTRDVDDWKSTMG